MSYVFSRRTFLKTSAVLAMAAATSGLLSGCEYTDPDNPVSTKLATTLEIAQTFGTLNSYDEATGVFNFTIESDYGIPLVLNPSHFTVKVVDAEGATVYNGANYGVTWNLLKGAPDFPRLYEGESATLEIKALNFVGPEIGQTVVFQYRPANSTYSMSWKLTKEAAGEGAEG